MSRRVRSKQNITLRVISTTLFDFDPLSTAAIVSAEQNCRPKAWQIRDQTFPVNYFLPPIDKSLEKVLTNICGEKKNSCPYPEISFSPAAKNRKNELLKFMLIDRHCQKRSLGRNRSADLKLLRKWLKIMKRSLAWAIMERWNGPEPEPSPSFKSQALVRVYLQKYGLRGCFFAFDPSVAFLRKTVVI